MMTTSDKSPYFQEWEGSDSTTTIAGGLPSPVSVLSEAQTTLQEISPIAPHVTKGDERQSTLHEVNLGKRKVSFTHSILIL